MALGLSSAESNSTGNSDGKPKGKKRTLGQIIDFCAKAVVMIVGLPIRAAAAIVNQFVANGGAGRALPGFLTKLEKRGVKNCQNIYCT
ncbi:hypothetical protein H6G97_29415 [Nostoc flagelliforme FACHB-838]|uniref:Transposase n=1 Tax=Nostoc flagelliforme FACHB-838 TaxID=2692904 RepID=A0ABR8DYJ8_9NOSO|nr:hypothetical protein [Nostoc flagelliforme]MBD2533459.1 hypothetical protein [Nostoc flagelliforme FACHB-838]